MNTLKILSSQTLLLWIPGVDISLSSIKRKLNFLKRNSHLIRMK